MREFRELCLVSVVILVVLVASSLPVYAKRPVVAVVKQWLMPFSQPSNPHDFVMAPDGAVFFNVAGVGTARLNPVTNELTTWPIGGFHIAIGPAFSITVDGQSFSEDFTIALNRISGSIILLMPNSGVRLRWDLATTPNDIQVFDITSSDTRLWFSLTTPATGDSTELASLDPGTNVLTRYNFPQNIAGPAGIIHGLSFGGGRLWYGVSAATSPELTAPFQQKVGSLHPATATARVWPLFAGPGGVVPLIGRAATFSAGSTWTFYHSVSASLTGAYQLVPGANTVRFFGAPLGTPGPTLPPSQEFSVAEEVDRATTGAGAAWAVTRATADANARVVRWQPVASNSEISVSPEQPTVSVSTTILSRDVACCVSQSTVAITPVTTLVSGTSISPNITIWTLADRHRTGHPIVSPDGKVYFGLLIPSTSPTSQTFVAQLSV